MEDNYDNLKNEYDDLKQKYIESLNKITELENHLKKYTAPVRAKKFYQTHKNEIKKTVREHQKQIGYKSSATVEKRKEYNKKAYEKRKEKQKLTENQ